MKENTYDMGLVGLGVMGCNLALNVADHGFSVLGLDRSEDKAAALRRHRSATVPVDAITEPESFLKALKSPKLVLFLVPAGEPVDAVIGELRGLLAPGDILIDGGNSHFKDTDRRQKALRESGVSLLGMGVSGGEEGARRGPSLMPGGPREAYDRARPILEAIAARAGGDPCVAYLGPGAVGHYVKMVHNGIEYALMQLLSETYDLFKRGLGYDADRLARTYAEWDRSEVSSFLVQITADIFRKTDPETGKQLVEMIVDAARQKGTGKWTTEETINLQVPAPAIDQAVVMRDLSRLREERRRLSEVLPGPSPRFDGDPEAMARALRDGFEVAMLLAYTQGFALLREASRQYGYGLSCETVARIWRGGCIIRATMLEDIAQAFRAQPDLELLMASPAIARTLGAKHGALREVVRIAARCGIPAPAFMASLGYYDGFRTANLPTNLTQAQRDYFGAHTYERLDRPGVFHTQWQ